MKRKPKLLVSMTTALFMVIGVPGIANAVTEEELIRKMEELERQMEEIRSLLNEAENKAESADEKAEAAIAAVEDSGVGSGGSSWADRTTIGGYGEVHYNNLNADDPARDKEEVDVHRFVLFAGHQFNERIRMFAELEVEHALVKDTDDGSNGGEVELEQAFIEFDHSDNLQSRAGVFLIPVGILNETHEPNTFYGVERNDVENIIIPTTWWEAGVGVNGNNGQGFSWDAQFHSGLEIPTIGSSAFRVRSGRQKVALASASDWAVTGRVKYTGVPGLELSASLQYQSDPSQVSGDGLDDGTLFTAHAIWQSQGFQLRALYGGWDFGGSAVEAAGADDQSGWYVEPSYKINEKWGVYARWSDVDGARTQDKFDQLELGFNYWPHPDVVLKANYRDRSHDLAAESGRDFTGFDLGVGYQF